MQLINLTLKNNNEIKRKINFIEGVNIITNTGNDGNNIGKSTVLKAINFCLGGKPESLWKDPSNNSICEVVKDYVTSGTFEFVLEIHVDNVKYEIKRILSLKGKNKNVSSINYINGEEFIGQTKFSLQIPRIFKYNYEHLSFATLKGRFFKTDKESINSLLSYSRHLKKTDYSHIYSFLFSSDSIEYIQRLHELEIDKKELNHNVNIILKGNTEEEYIRKAEVIKSSINNYDSQINRYNVSKIQYETIANLGIVRTDVANLSEQLSILDTRLTYNKKTIDKYQSKIENVDYDIIQNLYDDVIVFFGKPKRTLQEAVEFHNHNYKRKVEYLISKSVQIKDERNEIKSKLNLKIGSEFNLLNSITNKSYLSGFIQLENKKSDLYIELGGIQYVIERVSSLNQSINDVTSKIDNCKKMINSNMNNKNIKCFNRYLKYLSKKVYKDYDISAYFEINKGDVDLKVKNINMISGDGSPRAGSFTFELSLIAYLRRFNFPLPEFTLQDYLEATDYHKLKVLFDFSNRLNIQCVCSVLSSSLYDFPNDFLINNTILTLSSDDKLFGV